MYVCMIRIIRQNWLPQLLLQKGLKTHKQKKIEQQAKQIRHLLVSDLLCRRKSYLFCDSCKCWVMESRNQQYHKYVKYEYDEYFKLWIGVEVPWYWNKYEYV